MDSNGAEPIAELVTRIRAGHAVTSAEMSALLAAGVDPGALLDSLVAAAEGPESRRFHRALAVLRDVQHGREESV